MTPKQLQKWCDNQSDSLSYKENCINLRKEIAKELIRDFDELLHKYNNQMRQPYVLRAILDKIEQMKKDGSWIKSDLNE